MYETILSNKLAQIEANRTRSKPLPSGSAPSTSSDDFKVEKPGIKPKAKRYDHQFSLESRNQRFSPLKSAARNSNKTRMISLGTARPSPEFYPWESLTMTGVGSVLNGAQGPKTASAAMSCMKGEAGYDLSVALNYGSPAGSPQALRFVTEHIELVHDPPYEDWGSALTCGTTSALEIAFRIFCNRGDWILIENHTYTGTLATARAQGLNILGVQMDDDGLLPEDLEFKLQTWDPEKGRKPFLLYMIPTGQNPTGTTQGIARRKKIYQIAEKHDLYIIEDDPYFFLHMGADCVSSIPPEHPLEPGEFLKHLPTSYLSLDTSGRVMRIDTASKILAPGLRCGWVTACAQVIEKFLLHSEVGVLSPSGPSQVMLYKLLDETWGHRGFLNWLSYLSLQYRQRRDILVKACERHLPLGVCSWTIPTAGMFLWVRVDIPKNSANRNGISKKCGRSSWPDFEGKVFARAQENGVLISNGEWFAINEETQFAGCFRLTFAAAPERWLEEAVEQFGKALGSELGLCPNSMAMTPDNHYPN